MLAPIRRGIFVRDNLQRIGRASFCGEHTGKAVCPTICPSVNICKQGLQFTRGNPDGSGRWNRSEGAMPPDREEKDPHRFTELVKRLNDLLDGELASGKRSEQQENK
jgi:hypothetical protein